MLVSLFGVPFVLGWDQLGLGAFGVVAIWLVNHPRDRVRRWGCIFGMCGQPFWFWSAIDSRQAGVLLVVTLYTASWARGVWSLWLRPWLKARRAAGAALDPGVRRYTIDYVPAAPHAPRREKVYLAGPMTGVARHNYPAFAAWASRLRGSGYEVLSPAEHGEREESRTWAEWMRRGLRHLLECDRIAMMPGWERSRGAKVEHFVALALLMRPIYLRDHAR